MDNKKSEKKYDQNDKDEKTNNSTKHHTEKLRLSNTTPTIKQGVISGVLT